MKSENESQLGLRWVNGELCELVIHGDGREEFKPIPREEVCFEEFEEDPFKDTSTVPNKWDRDATTNVLEKKVDSREVTTTTLKRKSSNGSGRMRTVRERADQSCRLEALLVKIFGDDGDSDEVLNVNGNTALKEVLEDLCRIVGEPWSNRRIEL